MKTKMKGRRNIMEDKEGIIAMIRRIKGKTINPGHALVQDRRGGNITKGENIKTNIEIDII